MIQRTRGQVDVAQRGPRLQHELQHRRHQQPGGDLLVEDVLPRLRRVEGPHDDLRDAAVDAPDGRGERSDVEHRQGDEVAVGEVQVGRGVDGEDRPHRREVGVHHTLRQSRRARGVHDVEEVVDVGGHVDLLVRRRRLQRGVVLGPRRRVAVDLDERGEGGVTAAAQLVDGLAELGAEDDRGGAGVGEDERQLVGHEAPVQRHDHRTKLGDGEERLLELDRVHHHQGDAVAAPDAGRGQHVGGAVHPVVELGEREPAAGVDIDDRLEVRVDPRPLGHEVADVLRTRWHPSMMAQL